MRMRHKIPLTLLLASTVLPAPAQDRPASTDSVYACAAIEADDARLECYDEAVGALKQAEDAGEVVAVQDWPLFDLRPRHASDEYRIADAAVPSFASSLAPPPPPPPRRVKCRPCPAGSV